MGVDYKMRVRIRIELGSKMLLLLYETLFLFELLTVIMDPRIPEGFDC